MSVKYLAEPLTLATAAKAAGFNTVCAFGEQRGGGWSSLPLLCHFCCRILTLGTVNDDLSAKVLTRLKELGVAVIAMRCAGYNNVDIEAGASIVPRF